jgi:hypothetical protein
MNTSKLLAMITLVFGFALAAFAAPATEAKKEIPLGFKEAELIGTIEAIVMVKPELNLQHWRVRVDGRPSFYYVFTDEKGKVGDRIVIHIVVRVGGPVDGSWTKVRPLVR